MHLGNQRGGLNIDRLTETGQLSREHSLDWLVQCIFPPMTKHARTSHSTSNALYVNYLYIHVQGN